MRPKLGVLAMNSGMLTAAQVEEIHELQRSRDKRFGEIAEEKGYLASGQIQELLTLQDSRQLYLSQAILDKGYLNLSQMQQVLEEYKRDNRLSVKKGQEIMTADMDDLLAAALQIPEAGGEREWYTNYTSLLARNMVRFLDEFPLVGAGVSFDDLDITDHLWFVTQRAVGQKQLVTGLLLNDGSLLEIARCYSQENLTGIDELAKDSVAEFLNLVNGIYCVNASDQGLELDLKSPCTEKGGSLQNTKGYRIPLTLRLGRIELILGIVSKL
ncbi:hypothetical protein P22_1786 [Propionispora sp. 2/2-37]|uniref:hypothetical protein n=1 Tax=Propionispora sp. 2/2-37 TaxID=1677858 RepID=UPI0006BB76CA|nr:hypothetical protein [Propionispora sp. 2/2-37]CUH95708.1 hypothetical protein P22_1786 [Propionispora sp. 2/2-37]